MSQSQQHHGGGQRGNGGGSNGSGGGRPPTSQLDIYDGFVNPDTEDDISGKLGTGFYTEDEQWQQIESYLKGMYGDAAFGLSLYERAVQETIFGLGEKGWHWTTKDGTYHEKEGVELGDIGKRESPRKKIRERGEHIWTLLKETASEERLDALAEFAGITGDWVPPHWKMMETRHEASKSREARTQDNVFGTREHRSFEGEGETPKGRLKRFRSGGERRR